MKKKTALVAILATSALALTACSGDGASNGGGDASGDTYNWDMTITVSETSTWWAGAEKFGELLDEKSDGRMTLNIFANEQLSGGDPAAGVEMLSDGSKAFSYNSPIIYSGIDPRFSAITAPFLYQNYEEADAAIEAGAADAYAGLTEDMNIKMLGFGESGFRQLTNNSKEITAPEDIAGMKFRVAGSELFIEIYKELGADPVTMNFSEVFTSLQNGTIDGQENPFDVIYSNGLMEVQDYLSVWNYVYDPLILGMNLDMYNELSDEDKAIVDEAAAEANAYQIELSRDKESEQLAEMKEQMTVTELTPEQLTAFREALQPIYDAYTDKWTPEVLEAVTPQ
ncbi:DctP family TRAP transporter solute-binding subunit [Leucobacter denitrificans]|uniref:DctP family TRAP transporter solute-binding subunit n=1 Tax=Leucobacter denitrificans TaxID=683042 RepID=A0A7G9S6T5_9MICO|nr:DctP family TRAP transporter solute-binding subunit [Leucobacter denitrificans]QNN63560.1 DctP family TRAP transporter solute-binding subunit [Leucobacter denitrificans]